MLDISLLDDEAVISLFREHIGSNMRIDHSNIFHDTFDLSDEGDVDLFLREFSSLLNSNGGTLIYGIGATIEGINIDDKDLFCVTIKRIVKKKIDPKVPEDLFSFRFVDIGNARYLLLISVPGSDDRPHAVRTGSGSYSFFKRDVELRKLDVRSIRKEILSSSNIGDIGSYVMSRAESLNEGNGRVPLLDSGKLMINIVPGEAHSKADELDGDILEDLFSGMEWTDSNWVRTIEGRLGYYSNYSYIYLGSDLVLEAVDSFKMKPNREGEKTFNFVSYQKDIKGFLEAYRSLLGTLGIENGRFYFSISLVGMKGYTMDLTMHGKEYRFEKDMIQLPLRPIDIMDEGLDLMKYVNSYIDILWNSSGN